MAILSDNDAKEISRIFGALVRDVHIRVYTQKLECTSCTDTENILRELEKLSEKLNISFLNPQIQAEDAKMDAIERVPAIIISDGSNSRIRFYGTPSGYEFSSLLTTIVDIGSSEESLSEKTVEFLRELDSDLLMQVFVTPTCPHCPPSAVLASRMAGFSNKIRSEVIEANEFPELSGKFGVKGVPRTVINGLFYAEGSLSETMMVEALKTGLAENPSDETNLMDYLQKD